MQPLSRSIFLLLVLTLFASSAVARELYRNAIVGATEAPLVINVPERRLVRVVNFTQDGGAERGTLSVTRDSKSAAVMSANFVTESEVQKPLNIAGPAQITVTPKGGALFLSYRITEN